MTTPLTALIPLRQTVTDRLFLALIEAGVHPVAACAALAWLVRHEGLLTAEGHETGASGSASIQAALRSLRSRAHRFASGAEFIGWLSSQPCGAWRAASADCLRQWSPLEQSFEQFSRGCGRETAVTYRVQEDPQAAGDRIFAWMESLAPDFLEQGSVLLDPPVTGAALGGAEK